MLLPAFQASFHRGALLSGVRSEAIKASFIFDDSLSVD